MWECCTFYPTGSGSAIQNALGNPSTPILLDYLDCNGDEENLLECETEDPLQQQRKKRQQICETQEAGVVCAGGH